MMYCKICKVVGGHKLDPYNNTQYYCGVKRMFFQKEKGEE